jgi:hypothetical protein
MIGQDIRPIVLPRRISFGKCNRGPEFFSKCSIHTLPLWAEATIVARGIKLAVPAVKGINPHTDS